jgi:simple sugar transport system permease protein
VNTAGNASTTRGAAERPAARGDIGRKLFGRNELYLFILIVVISFVLSFFNKDYATMENLFDILRSYSFMGIMAVGVLVVLISGGIDISFTAIATVAQYVMAILLARHKGLSPAVALLVPLVIGTALGAVNAALTYYLRAPAIIVTIGTLNVFYGVLVFLSGGKWIYNFPGWFRNVAKLNVFHFVNREGILYGFSVLTAVWAGVVVFALALLKYTSLGRKVYAMGSNVEAARRVGLNLFGLQLFVYSFMGLLSGLASIIQALLAQTVAPNAIMGRELDVIAAVVLGGASLFGGEGTLLGTLLGVALIAVMGNGLTLMRVSAYWHGVAVGMIIIISVSITALQRRAASRRSSAVNVD